MRLLTPEIPMRARIMTLVAPIATVCGQTAQGDSKLPESTLEVTRLVLGNQEVYPTIVTEQDLTPGMRRVRQIPLLWEWRTTLPLETVVHLLDYEPSSVEGKVNPKAGEFLAVRDLPSMEQPFSRGFPVRGGKAMHWRHELLVETPVRLERWAIFLPQRQGEETSFPLIEGGPIDKNWMPQQGYQYYVLTRTPLDPKMFLWKAIIAS